MTLFSLCRSHRRVLVAAGALALALTVQPLAAGKVKAFTIDDHSNTNADGSAKFSDPDSRLSGNGNNGMTTYRSGPMSLQFGTQRTLTDQRYNTDRMFNPNGRPGDYDGR
jgi:hypothetical protein